jgi:hypothetical protein
MRLFLAILALAPLLCWSQTRIKDIPASTNFVTGTKFIVDDATYGVRTMTIDNVRGVGTNNLFLSDGTLAGNRRVFMDGKLLSFEDGSAFQAEATNVFLDGLTEMTLRAPEVNVIAEDGFHLYTPRYFDTSSSSNAVLTLVDPLTGKAEFVTLEELRASTQTADRVLVLDGNKKLRSAAPSASEIDYVAGATNTIQAQIDARITHVPTVADLLALSPYGVTLANTMGYHAAGDGGSGTYRWTATASGATNRGTLFAGSSGFWNLIQDGSVSVRQFGAKGDAVTDDLPAIQDAIDWAAEYVLGVVHVPQGTYSVSGSINWKATVYINGVGTFGTDGTPSFTDPDANNYRLYGASVFRLANGANVPLIYTSDEGRRVRQTNQVFDSDQIAEKRLHGGAMYGMVLDGNGANQTRYDCHNLLIEPTWQIKLNNVVSIAPRGYHIFALDVNVLDIKDCSFKSTSVGITKGIFLPWTADSNIHGGYLAGVEGAGIWVTGAGGWYNRVNDFHMFNQRRERFQITDITDSEITVASNHTYETGMPVEIDPDEDSGAVIPAGVTFGRQYWAVKTAANKIKLARGYYSALGASNLVTITDSGTGTNWLRHGPAAAFHASYDARHNMLVGNRMDQQQEHIVSLVDADSNVIVGNLINQGQHNTTAGIAEVVPAAGVRIRGPSSHNIVSGNDLSARPPTYPMSYGVWVSGTGVSNRISANTFKDVAVMPIRVDSDSLLSTIIPAEMSAQQQLIVGTTTNAVPALILRTGSAAIPAMRILREGFDIMSLANSDAFVFRNTTRALDLAAFRHHTNAVTSAVHASLIVGSFNQSTNLPAAVFGSWVAGTDQPAGPLLLVSGLGTSAGSVTNAAVEIHTAVSASSGSNRQSYTRRARFDSSAGAGESPMLLWDGSQWLRVSYGAPDSGGSGYRVLRVANE